MLAGGLHVHWHTHDGQSKHGHVITAFDADHEWADAGKVVDQENLGMAVRAPASLPDALWLFVAMVVVLAGLPQRIAVPRPQPPRLTGPPPRLRPPSQAPPHFSATA